MKKVFEMMLSALLIVNIASCSSDCIPEQANTSTEVFQSYINAYMPDADSRVVLEDIGSAINVDWEEEDTISLVVDIKQLQPDSVNYFNYTTYTYVHDTCSRFVGSAPLVLGTEFYAFYPAQDEYWRFPTAFSMYGIEMQAGVLDKKLTAMYAKSTELAETNGLYFQHLTAIIKSTFFIDGVDATAELTKVTIDLPSDVYVGGGVDLKNDAAFWYGNTIVVTPEQSLNNFYIYLPKGIEADDEICFTAMRDGDTENCYVGKLKATKAIEAGKVYPVNGIELTAQSL